MDTPTTTPSAPEPTAEHVRLAREALPVNATPGQVNRIARALAAAEARGFERGFSAARQVGEQAVRNCYEYADRYADRMDQIGADSQFVRAVARGIESTLS